MHEQGKILQVEGEYIYLQISLYDAKFLALKKKKNEGLLQSSIHH